MFVKICKRRVVSSPSKDLRLPGGAVCLSLTDVGRSCASLSGKAFALGARVAEQEFIHIADVPVLETWTRLEADPKAVLIDVRTKAEWAFVGVPDLSALGRKPVMIEWQSFPDSRVDAQFADRLAAQLAATGAGKDDALYFICRSGGRSRMAAEVMAEAGFRRCANVAEGFEGPLDTNRHRGQAAGWKAAGLPWMQG